MHIVHDHPIVIKPGRAYRNMIEITLWIRLMRPRNSKQAVLQTQIGKQTVNAEGRAAPPHQRGGKRAAKWAEAP